MSHRYLKRVEHEGKPRKNSSYLSSTHKDTKNGVLEESKNILVYQYQVGYINSQMSSETQRIFEGLSNKINTRWKSIGRRYLDEMQKSLNFWTSVV